MKVSYFGACALGICAGILMLAGCGTPSLVAPDDTGRVQAGGAPVRWDLLYVSNSDGTVVIYRYWQQELFATLSGFQNPKGECVDEKGDVFVTDAGLQEILEYAHGGKTAINTISDTGYQPYACSVDFRSGKLAVANYATASGYAGNVAVYANASGKATYYKPNLDGYGPLTCGYDDAGNLLIATEYASGSYEDALFAMLPKNGGSFRKIELSEINKSPFAYVTNVQWDGEYWAVTDNGNIQRYSIAKNLKATYEGTTDLTNNWTGDAQVWITNTTSNSGQEANQMVAAESADVQYWKYPSGGRPYAYIEKGLTQPYGVTVSLAPGAHYKTR